MSLDKEYYAALSSGDAAKINDAKAACLAAGYAIGHDGSLSATGAVKDAPAPISPEKAKLTFEGDSKGIKKKAS